MGLKVWGDKMGDRDAKHTLSELQEARAEIDRLRDLLRWRSAEAERPENGTFCLIILKNSLWPNVIQHSEGMSWNPEFITHWRPIGPLPGEGGSDE